MSWHCSRALEAEYLAACCSDGEPSAPSKSTPIADKSLCSAKMTESLIRSPSGTTCEHSTEPNGADLLTWYRRDSLASRSVSRASSRRLTMTETAGRQPLGFWEKFGRHGCYLRMSQGSLLPDTLPPSSATWPRSAMWDATGFYPLPALERRTGVKGSGLLATPVAYDATPGGPGNHYHGLGWMAKQEMWPTPTASDAGTHHSDCVRFQSLDVYVRGRRPATEAGGALNPDWVEWLMGWPIGWTVSKPLETAKFQEWWQQFGR